MRPVLEYNTTLGWTITKQGGKIVNTEYYVKNADGKKLIVSPSLYQLLDHADGWHPFVCDGVSPDTMKRVQKDLVRYKILRTSRFVFNGLINQFILLPVGERVKCAKDMFAKINRLLPWLALVWFVIGVFAAYSIATNENWSSIFSIPLLVTLIIASILIHEGSHLMAAVAYNCEVYELGVLLFGVIPYGAYVSISDNPKERFQRVQLNLAGPESNVMIAGVYMLLASIFHSYEMTLWVAAFVSLAQGLLNSIPAMGLDGHGALSGAFGVDSIHQIAKDTVFNKAKRRRLLAGGSSGRKCLCLLSGVLLCDILVLCLIGVDVMQVLLAIVSAMI